MTRNTKAKIIVEKILSSTVVPLSLQTLNKKILSQLPSVAFSMLFRIIQSFTKENKVIKVDWRERGSRYEWAKREHHHHLVCESCELVIDLNDSAVNYNQKVLSSNTGFIVKHHSIEMSGICKKCQENTKI